MNQLKTTLALVCTAYLLAACATSESGTNADAADAGGGGKGDDASADASVPQPDASLPLGDSDDIYGTDVARADSYWVADGNIFRGSAEITLRGINWFGLETTDNALHGLWSGRTVDEILDQVAGLGFNALRVPVSHNSIQPGFSAATWANHGEVDTGHEHLRELLSSAGSRGIRILLDIHTCDPSLGGGHAAGPEACPGYTRDNWLDDLRSLATLAIEFDNVVGIDLFNEPYGLTWSQWRTLAALGGEAVLTTNPRILVFVEGVGDASPAGGFSPFWGENLSLAGDEPVDIPFSRLVYSPHVYGPGVATQDYFDVQGFPGNMPTIWDAHFGYLVSAHPIAIGEFGGRYTGQDGVWQDAFVDFLLARSIRHFFYWSLNPNSGDTGGLLLDDWTTVDEGKLALLRRLGL